MAEFCSLDEAMCFIDSSQYGNGLQYVVDSKDKNFGRTGLSL